MALYRKAADMRTILTAPRRAETVARGRQKAGQARPALP